MGHTTTTTADRLCRGCGGTLRLLGDDPLLPEPLRKAVHGDGSETCADGETLAAPIGADPVSLP
jgi:hypothetical protein